MIKGMIFDLDGTLISSMDVWAQIDVEFLGRRGLAVPPDYLQAITPMGFLNAAKYTIDRFGFSETPEQIEEEWMQMAQDAYAHHIEMKPGARPFLEACRAMGMRLAVATSSLERLYVPCLQHHGIADLFETAVTTRQVGEDKHSPKIYLTAASNLGLQPCECIVFEDILLGIHTAAGAGFHTVGVYEAASRKDHAQMRDEAEYFIDSYETITPAQLVAAMKQK